MSRHYEILLDKIDRFIRRYYLNQVIRGALWFAAGFLILFIAIAILEHVGYFSREIRLLLFYGFLSFNLLVFLRYVLRPFLGLMRIGKRIRPLEAGRILERHFPEQLGDRITNALQLKRLLDDYPDNTALIMAGLEQKSKATVPVPFQEAISLKGNLRFLPLLLLPMVVAATVLLVSPALLVEPARRILRYETHFERPVPFVFYMESPGVAFRNEAYDLVLRARGDVLPEVVEIRHAHGRHRMVRGKEAGQFSHRIRTLREDLEFYVDAAGYRLGPYHVQVVHKPSIRHFETHTVFPAYTGLPDERTRNTGDLFVARGARIAWRFHAAGGEVIFHKEGGAIEAEKLEEGIFLVTHRAMQSFEYTVKAVDETHGPGDSLSFHVQVRPDAYPDIRVEHHEDEVLVSRMFHTGQIHDDYGFDRLEMHYRVADGRPGTGDREAPMQIRHIPVDQGLREQRFYHHMDMHEMGLGPGQSLEYHFVVYDNDAIQGPKASSSRRFSWYMPSLDEQIVQRREGLQQMGRDLEQRSGAAREGREEMDQLRQDLLESESLGWEQRDRLEQIMEKQQEMEERLKRLQDDMQKDHLKESQLRESSERIRKKQQELQRLFNEVMPSEMRDLFDELRRELEGMDRNQVFDMVEQMRFEMRDLESRLERALELYRHLQMEQLLEESMHLLDHLSEKQQHLADDEPQAEAGYDASQMEAQEEVKEGFDVVEELMEELRQINEQLNRPRELDDTRADEEAIKQQLEQLQVLMQRQDPGTSPAQQNAAESLDGFRQRLQEMQHRLFSEELAEDARALREVLENLLKTSFAQEDLMKEVQDVHPNDPRYTGMVQDQRKIRADLETIQDTLIAISRRQTQIQSFVNREIEEIQMNIARGVDHMINRRRAQAAGRQQFVMTHVNNLALMLNESLQNMRRQMAEAQGFGDGEGMGGEPSFGNMRQMQEQLNQMLEQMREGHIPMPGETGEAAQSMSEAMVRMAAEQQAIRRQLEEMAAKMRGEGQLEQGELLELQREMEQTELDIIRREIGRQTMQRQERILSRLLEHERAEMVREMDEERAGTTAADYPVSAPDEYLMGLMERERLTDVLRRMPPELRPYYREMVERYLTGIRENPLNNNR